MSRPLLGFLRLVALRKESVDRNFIIATKMPTGCVALRKESVDRNYKERPGQKARPVALRKESVDRNDRQVAVLALYRCRSPQGERG